MLLYIISIITSTYLSTLFVGKLKCVIVGKFVSNKSRIENVNCFVPAKD